MDDHAFEHDLLTRAAARIEYPTSPQLRGRVLASVGRPTTSFVVPRGVVAGAVLALAAIMALVLAVPASRDAVAEFFGVSGSRVERIPEGRLPAPTDLDVIATPVSLEAAAAATGFIPALPDGHADPDATYVVEFEGQAVVVLQYDGFDLWQSRAVGFFEKGLPPGAELREFTVGGQPAYWITGGGHIVEFVGPDGEPVFGSRRTVTRNTLIWSTDDNFYRIETDLTQAEAASIAATLP